MADDLMRELLRRRMEDAEKTIGEALSEAAMKAFEIVNTEESPIFGGIDRSTNKFWRNNG
jgi:hypothetical protein